MSERHIAALVRELEMAEVEDVQSVHGANLDDSLLDLAFDDEHVGWGAHGQGQYRPRPERMTAHLLLDGENSD